MSGESPWPNLFVVGAAKAGTTSLWRYLGEHPEIFMTYFKEPHFFSGHRPFRAPCVHDEAAYLRLFAPARTPFRGEASTSYLHVEAAAARIKHASPDARIVIGVRDPVERSHSMYWQRVRVGVERRSFAAAVAAELEPGLPPQRGGYVSHVRHARNVARFLGLFGANVHVVVFEELIGDVRRELRRLFDFLGVDPAVADGMRPDRHNPFAQPRNRFAARLLGAARTRKAARALVPYTLRWPIESRLLETRPKPPLDPETDRLLTEFFAPDVRELTMLLGRGLPWPRWAGDIAEPEPARHSSAAGL